MNVLAIGGAMANTFLYAMGLDIGKSICEKSMRETALSILADAKKHGCKIVLPVDLVVTGCVAVGEDGARLGKGGGFADLEFALATAAGLIGPHTLVVTTVHELQVRPAGLIPTAAHDAPVDLVVTPDRVLDCRPLRADRPTGGIRWSELTEAKIAAIPLLGRLRPA